MRSVELDGEKDTTEILKNLSQAYPQASCAAHTRVQSLLGPINQQLVQSTVAALRAGDVRKIGELMHLAQAEFDAAAMPMCPSQLTAPNLHRVLSHESLKPHIWGGKGVGSQGDGCAQLLCRSRGDAQIVLGLVESELNMKAACLEIGGKERKE